MRAHAPFQVVGVVSHNPRDSDDTLSLDETRYLACIRSTDRVELSNAGVNAATAGHHLTSMRWPVVMPPPAHSAARREVPLRAFTLGVVPLDFARLGIVATIDADGRGGSYVLGPPAVAAAAAAAAASAAAADGAGGAPAYPCPQGHGACQRKTSRTTANPNRDFYKCGTCGHFTWADRLGLAAPGGATATAAAAAAAVAAAAAATTAAVAIAATAAAAVAAAPPSDASTARISALHALTLDDASRDAARVPSAATHFAFGYPGASGGDLGGAAGGLGGPSESFLAAGGFLYFARRGGGGGGGGGFRLCGATAFTRSAGQGLRFEGPVQLYSPACRQQLAARLATPTMDLFTSVGVRHYSWLAPHEPLGPHDGSGWPDGGFAYLWDEAEAELDCVFCLHECREHEPIARLAAAKSTRGTS